MDVKSNLCKCTRFRTHKKDNKMRLSRTFKDLIKNDMYMHSV